MLATDSEGQIQKPYKDNGWYAACAGRNKTHFLLSVTGDL
jgi:hypothetical protein